MSYQTIEEPQVSKNFGKINKVIWFKVNDIDGIFNLNLYVNRSQSNDITLTVFNKETGEEKYKKIFTKSSNSNTISDNLKINHIKGFATLVYGIKTT